MTLTPVIEDVFSWVTGTSATIMPLPELTTSLGNSRQSESVSELPLMLCESTRQFPQECSKSCGSSLIGGQLEGIEIVL